MEHKHIRMRKVFIIFVTLSGLIINAIYGIELFRTFLAPQYNHEIKETIGAIVPNMVFAFFYSGLYVVAYFLGKIFDKS